ncbi:MAG TPA: hypothetical protein VN739_04440, partial [Nitrososphaerales archaeon]|nr:hypothetical protein [Nitrososphaerales archaeon]
IGYLFDFIFCISTELPAVTGGNSQIPRAKQSSDLIFQEFLIPNYVGIEGKIHYARNIILGTYIASDETRPFLKERNETRRFLAMPVALGISDDKILVNEIEELFILSHGHCGSNHDRFADE